MLRNAQVGPNVYPGVPAEYTNWRDEQWAWQHTCVLFNQSFHMAELAVRGTGCDDAAARLGVNTFNNFDVDKAKQFVPCTPDGYVIGDVILFHLADEDFNLVGRAPVLNWVTYHAQTGGYDVRGRARPALRAAHRRPPQALPLPGAGPQRDGGDRDERSDAEPPELKFFNLTTAQIGGVTVRALRHGMAGPAGLGAVRPVGGLRRGALGDRRRRRGVRAAAGRRTRVLVERARVGLDPLAAACGLHRRRAYARTANGCPPTGYEGSASIGGSFVSDDIEDYYFTPWDLGYGHLVKFDHDFIGREALERMADDDHRHKVTLALDDDDVADTIATMFDKTDRAKFIDWPSAVYSMHPFDRVIAERRHGRRLDLVRLQLQRGQDADAGGARRRARASPGPR